MRWRNGLAGLLMLIGVLLVVSMLRAEEPRTCPAEEHGIVQPPPPPPPVSSEEGGQRVIPMPTHRFATTPEDLTPAPTSDEAFVRELLAILNETHSEDAFLVTLSILHELKAEPRLAVPAIIRNAERLKLFGCTAPDQATEKQKMVAGCIAGLIKRDDGPAPLPATATTAVPGSTTGEVPCVTPPAGATKPISSEVVPGEAKTRRTRRW